MLFNSLQYIFFFAVVFVVYFIIPQRWRWVLLLIASYYFYMCWKAEYAILIIFSTLVDYWAGIRIGSAQEKSKKRKFLILSLTVNLGLLFSFKYFNFFSESFRVTLNHFSIFYDPFMFKVLLPVGISFYTFQAMSYTIDVYRGVKTPERHLGIFALYVVFFPQLVAGPIERATRLLPQFYEQHNFDYKRVTDGIRLIMWGMFEKVVIADRLAILVNQIYNHPTNYSGIPLILATYFFAFQIYCDFAGYCDIALGSARVLGFRLMDNFKRPYFATSIPEFWQRWHISLSTWFKDYVYFSLGGNRVAKGRWYLNIFLVFLISGLWHGANWTFAVWGILHGIYYLCSIWFRSTRVKIARLLRLDRYPRIRTGVQVLFTFHLVTFAWVFFRANSLSDAVYVTMHLFDFSTTTSLLKAVIIKTQTETLLGLSKLEILLSIGLICMLLAVHLFQRLTKIMEVISSRPIWLRWSMYYLVVFSIILLGKYGSRPFIYFQF